MAKQLRAEKERAETPLAQEQRKLQRLEPQSVEGSKTKSGSTATVSKSP